MLYGISSGPYVISEREVVSARELASSGAEDGLIIAVALMSFLVSALAPLVIRGKPASLLMLYVANYGLYVALLLLAQMDTSLIESVRLGDWLLFLGLVVPTATLCAYAAIYRVTSVRAAEA
jgi:hypothetical protein